MNYKSYLNRIIPLILLGICMNSYSLWASSEAPIMNINFTTGDFLQINIHNGMILTIDDSTLVINAIEAPYTFEIANVHSITYIENLSKIESSSSNYNMRYELYPNRLEIFTTGGINYCEIISSSGMILNSFIFDTHIAIDLARYKSGIYIARIAKNHVIKFIVK